MGVQMISVKCPACGADLSIEENRKQAFCSYCGSKVILNNDTEHVYRTIDEAGVKQAEADYMIRMRQLQLEEQKIKIRNILIIVWLISTGVFALLGIIGIIINVDGLGLCLMLAMVVGLWGALFLFVKKK